MEILNLLIFTFCLLTLGDSKEYSEDGNSTSSRDAKYFPFLKVLTIPPNPCGGRNNVKDGVCLPRGKCASYGGSKDSAECGMGLGECCRFMEMCNETRTEIELTREVYTIKSPMSIRTDCSFRVKKKKDYCQIRLDFVSYMSRSANTQGICDRDSFTVRGSSTVQDGFRTCGNLNGQHMYLEFGRSDYIDLIPSFSADAAGSYEIVVRQIPCNSADRVPPYCFQHFAGKEDKVMSFDFGQQQQSSQEYTVCFGWNPNADAVMLKPCAAQGRGLDIVTAVPPLANCNNRDWIQFNGMNRMCLMGDVSVDGVEMRQRPFIMNVHFNELEMAELPCDEYIRTRTAAECGLLIPAAPAVSPDDFFCANSYDGCQFEADAGPGGNGRCTCSLKQAVVATIDFDGGNTGFCFDYMLNSRRL